MPRYPVVFSSSCHQAGSRSIVRAVNLLLWVFLSMSLLVGLGCAFNGPKYAIQTPISVSIKPIKAILTTGRTMTFGHTILSPLSTDVSWSLLDASGGTVDGKGNYQAPDHPGTFRLRVTALADQSKTAEAKIIVVAPPQGPMTAPDVAESGASGLRASVPFRKGLTYAWTLEGGLIQTSPANPEIRFSVGSEPKAVLHCRIQNEAGDALTLLQEMGKVPPVTFHLLRTSAILTAGRSMQFGYSLSGGLPPAVIWSVPDPKHGSVDQNGRYTAPGQPGKYLVRAMPDVAPQQVASIEVTVVDPPVGTILVVKEVAPDSSDHLASIVAPPGLKTAWSIKGGSIIGPADGPTLSFSANKGPELILSCTLTNEAGDTFTAHRQIVVGVAP